MPRDNTKYIFNNIQYGKGRLVQAVINQFVLDRSPSFDVLKNQFPSSLHGSLDVVIDEAKYQLRQRDSNDTKKRYFREPVPLPDGEVIYVTDQWGSGNIDSFITKARSLGYAIEAVGDVTKTIRERYEEYKLSPRTDWIPDYKARCAEVQGYKQKEPSEYDDDFLKNLWLVPSNGIASAAPGFISNEEFENLYDDLPAITSKIIHAPSPETLSEVLAWAEEAGTAGKFKTIKRGVIHRVFAAADPQKYSTILRNRTVVSLINRLNKLYDLRLGVSGNWAEKNIELMKAIKSQGLQDEDVFLVNTFVWELSEALAAEDKATGTDLIEDEDVILSPEDGCVNIIYYGPPGTGKTYRLQKLLDRHYTDKGVLPDEQLWLIGHIEKLSWYEVIILVLMDSGEPMKVADITAHEYYQIKAELNEREGNLRATAWSSLQSHTIQESATVKLSKRIEPLIFDKTQKSLWFIADGREEQLGEYRALHVQIKEGPESVETVKRFEFVTFHQSYGYEEFIEGLRPVTNSEGDISYEIKPGVFKRICRSAEADPENKYAIVIDEINRGNISKIFGELITLVEVDKRAGAKHELSLTLPYSGKSFSVPANLDIIGTMNTADRSLTHIDVALRRRFNFEELRTDYSLIPDNIEGINLRRLLYAINQRIELLLDRDHILGHALAMNVKSLDDLAQTFKTNIMPLLEEYFFEDWGKISQVLNNNSFIKEQDDANSIWLRSADDYMVKTYRLNSQALKDIEAYKEIYSGIDSSNFAECERLAVES